MYKSNFLLLISGGEVKVEGAKIVQSEVFVYNLGTMFYIDKVLFADQLPEFEATTTDSNTDTSEWAEGTEPASHPDVLLQDGTTTEQVAVSTILP